MTTPWTDEHKARLKQWWLEERLSSTRIVELFRRQGFDTTRNAIIGAVHRSDWWPSKPRTRRPPKRAARPPKVVKIRIEPLPPPPAPVQLRTPPEKPPPQPAPGEPLYLSVVQIGYQQCRYWYGESRGQAGRDNQTGYCGHKASGSWCDEHFKLVYAKTAPREKINVRHKF